MKVRCVKDSYKETKGIFNKTIITVKIKGLTEGKVYHVNPVSIVSGEGNIGFGSIETTIKFLVFNDDGVWDTYSKSYFVPVEE